MSQAEVSGAEAASAAASGALSGLSVGSDMLTPLINRAKQQLEVERARGGLHKAMAAAKTDADLPQLDAAIQAARRAGVQDRVTEASRCILPFDFVSSTILHAYQYGPGSAQVCTEAISCL